MVTTISITLGHCRTVADSKTKMPRLIMPTEVCAKIKRNFFFVRNASKRERILVLESDSSNDASAGHPNAGGDRRRGGRRRRSGGRRGSTGIGRGAGRDSQVWMALLPWQPVTFFAWFCVFLQDSTGDSTGIGPKPQRQQIRGGDNRLPSSISADNDLSASVANGEL